MIEELIEAGIDMSHVKVRHINLAKGEQFSKEFSARNPNQKIPVLIDNEISVMESCAILHYLGEKYPTELLPIGKPKWEIIPWVYWQAANVGPAFGNKLSYTRYMDAISPEQKAHPLERFNKEAIRLVTILNEQLKERPWLAGNTFTIADIALYPWLRAWKWSKVDITPYPLVMSWIENVRERPGVGRGLAYGAPEGEIDQWSEERKAKYRKNGSIIANPDY
jgi:GST-like protein